MKETTYKVTYMSDGKKQTIHEVVNDGYIMLGETALPIRWFLTPSGMRLELSMAAGSAITFGPERQQVINERDEARRMAMQEAEKAERA